MVKRVVGYDDKGAKVFDREAREYDKGIANTVFGITVGDVFKVIPLIFLCGMVWANQQSINDKMSQMIATNTLAIKDIANTNSKTFVALTEYVSRMDSYLSATTGKRFKNGEPYEFQKLIR